MIKIGSQSHFRLVRKDKMKGVKMMQKKNKIRKICDPSFLFQYISILLFIGVKGISGISLMFEIRMRKCSKKYQNFLIFSHSNSRANSCENVKCEFLEAFPPTRSSKFSCEFACEFIIRIGGNQALLYIKMQ